MRKTDMVRVGHRFHYNIIVYGRREYRVEIFFCDIIRSALDRNANFTRKNVLGEYFFYLYYNVVFSKIVRLKYNIKSIF